jgi:hypothetical protein
LVIALSQAIEREGRSAVEWIGVPSHQIHAESEIVLRLDKLAQIVDQEDPSLRSMEAAIGGALAFIPAQDVAPRGIIAGDLHDLRCP